MYISRVLLFISVTSAVHQSASIVSSTISIAWSMASYHKNVRIAYENRKNLGYTGVILQFLWHIMITSMFICNRKYY